MMGFLRKQIKHLKMVGVFFLIFKSILAVKVKLFSNFVHHYFISA